MILHHTKNKGDLGVLKVKCHLVSLGYMILQPETEHAPFDIVAYRDGKFCRIQIKYRALNQKGLIELALSSCWTDKHGIHTTHIDRNVIDIYAVYCPNNDTCYFFNPSEINATRITLRFEPAKTGQTKGIRMAHDYQQFNMPG